MPKKTGALKALRDIESLFEPESEITPFLEELFTFLSDLLPIIAKANQSIRQTAASMPSASDNITSANKMAESATNTIMDNIEAISTELSGLIEGIEDVDSKEKLASVANRVDEISISLQFQDITSQHLKQATQIVEGIQIRMNKLFISLQEIGKKNKKVRNILELYLVEDEDIIPIEDTVRRDDSISQADIDALFGN